MSSNQRTNEEVEPASVASVSIVIEQHPTASRSVTNSSDFGDELNAEEKKLLKLVKHGRPGQVEEFLKVNFPDRFKSDAVGTSSNSSVPDADDSISPANATLDINKKDSECHSVLQLAVFRGDVEIVKLLLDAGCTDPCALDLAGALRHNEVLRLLIDNLPMDNSNYEDTTTPHEIDGNNSKTSEDNAEVDNRPNDPNNDSPSSNWIRLRNDVWQYVSLKVKRARKAMKTLTIHSPITVSDDVIRPPDKKAEDIKDCTQIRRMVKAAIDAEDYSQTEQLSYILRKSFPEALRFDCTCPKHRSKTKKDVNVLQEANERLEICNIISSPLYIITAPDPIWMALDRNTHLEELAYWHSENKKEFLQLAKRSSEFAIDLLETCEDDSEAELLFTIDLQSDPSKPQNVDRTFKYKLQLDAVGLMQKQFVSHPTCQLVVSKLWYGTYYSRWRDWSAIERFYHVVSQVLLTPFMFIMYACKERSKQKDVIDGDLKEKEFWIRTYAAECLGSPLNRFIYAVTSYLFFIMTVVSKQYVDREKNWPYPSVDGYDLIIGIWITGHILKLLTDFFVQRHMSYTRLWWISYDAITMSIFVIGALTFFIGFGNKTANWRAALLSQGFYSIAITLACLRTLQWLHLSGTLGPLVISFSEMTVVIRRLLVVFAIVVISFSTGIYTVYKNFHTDFGEDHRDDTFFRSYVKTMKILFWAIFGKGEANYASIPDNYQYLQGNVTVTSELQQHFTVIVGYILWSFFHIAVVIVLLNMLIAVMTNYYQLIQDNGDTEWKFARTKLRLYYIEKTNMFPPPFNILFMIVKLIKWLYQECCKLRNDDHTDNTESDQREQDPDPQREVRNQQNGDHQALMKKLKRRYRQDKELAKIRARAQHNEMTSLHPQRFSAQNARDLTLRRMEVKSAEC